MGISCIFLYEAYVHIGVGLSSMLYYCGPAIAMFLSPFIFGERFTAAGTLGFAIVAMGALLICSDSVGGTMDAFGYALGIGFAVAHAVMVIAGKSVTEVSGPENSSLQLILAFASVLAYSLAVGSLPTEVDPSDWLPIMALGILNTGFRCLLYFATIPKLKAQTISVWGYLGPLSALVTGTIVLGESMGGLQWAGTMLVLAATLGADSCPPEERARTEPGRPERKRARPSGAIAERMPRAGGPSFPNQAASVPPAEAPFEERRRAAHLAQARHLLVF